MTDALRHSRRDVLRAAATIAGAIVADPRDAFEGLIAAQSGGPCAAEGASGQLVATLPLSRPDGIVQPFGTKIGRGLDARLFTDLSRLEPSQLVTPTPLAYVRTECPPAMADRKGPWTIGALTLDDLARRARPMGAQLFECSGNSNPANFGLMSVAQWSGVPLAEVVSLLRPGVDHTGVLVRGVDPDQSSPTSVAGASWIFPLESLDRLGAFLAVGMNGGALPLDHGAPIRLVVPGWYGCAWIKWVDEIRFVGAREPATPQMKEFSARTHQTAIHELAKDYSPPAIDSAAMPIRVEKRRGGSGLEYRIAGIVWGGPRPVDRLAIRFPSTALGAGTWSSFAICPAPRTSAIWSLWTYRWKPAAAGLYEIALRVPDPSVPQRRLDMGYYVRQVRIDEI